MYTLNELLNISTDAWVNAICHVEDIFQITTKECDCPAEYSIEIDGLCQEHNIHFDCDGNIAVISF